MEITKEIAQKVVDVVNVGLCSGLGKPNPGEMCIEAAVCFAMGLPHSDNPPCVSPSIRALKISLNDSNWSSKEARGKGMIRLAVLQLGTKDNFNELEFINKVVQLTITKTVPNALRKAASIHTDIKHKEALENAAIRCETEKSSYAASDAASYAARAASDAASYAARAARAASDAARAASDAASYAASDAASDAARAARAASDAARAASDAASYAASDAASYAARAASDAARAASYAASDAARAASDAASYAASDKELLNFAKAIEDILIEMNVPGVQWLDLIEKD